MRVLIIGIGSIGKRHLDNILALGVLDLAALRSKSAPIVRHENVPVFTDLDAALAWHPDVVLVCGPTSTHIPCALAAARAGCHIFVEKPLSHSFDGVEQLLEEVRVRSLVSMVGFDLRFDPGLRKVKEVLDSGALGRIVFIQAQVGQYLPDWHPTEDYRNGVSARRETGGGVILDLIHEFDYITWLAGPIERVACFAGHRTSLEIETEDVASIILEFQSGAVGSVCLDYVQRIPSRTCRIIGEEGTIVWDLLEQRVSWFLATEDVWRLFEYPGFARNDRFLAEARHLVECVQGHATPPVDAQAGARILRVALSAKRSAEHQRVVAISRDAGWMGSE